MKATRLDSDVTVADILRATRKMRRHNVPTHDDGTYHVHLTSQGTFMVMSLYRAGRTALKRAIRRGVADALREAF